jgi:hypothetical protein
MRAFIHSITLPDKYWITPSNNHQSKEWMDKFDQKLTSGSISLVVRCQPSPLGSLKVLLAVLSSHLY